MTQLYEVIAHKKVLDRKIKELRKLLSIEQDEDLAEELLAALELKQGKLITIHLSNKSTTITIGETALDIATAVIIRDTIKERIDYVTDLISSPDCHLNKLELIRQREKYFEEYIIISSRILQSDVNLKIG